MDNTGKESSKSKESVSEWKELTAQQLVRYEALFSLLNDIQGEDIEGIAQLVARQWKYFANVASWRLVVCDDEDYLVIDGKRGRAYITETNKNGVSDWDKKILQEARPKRYDAIAIEEGISAPQHLLGDNISQIEVLPIMQKDDCAAVLSVASRHKPFDELDNRFIRLLGNFFSERVKLMMLQNRVIKILETKATRDSLTGLLNRGAVLEQFDTALAYGKRNQNNISIILADIDYFKPINDTYGHQAGDKALRDVAKRLGKIARESDSIGRYGGEEFFIILNNCGREDVFPIAERFRESICKEKFHIDCENPEDVHITISLGTASSDGGAGFNKRDLIRDADRALYESKKHGRNRVTVNKSY